MSSTVDRTNIGKRLARGAFGAAVGFGGTKLFLSLSGPHLPFGNPAAMFTFTVGLIYLLIGSLVGVGAASPRAGAHFLNVEDSEELQEQRVMLAYASASCVLVALFLLILAFSAPGAQQTLFSANIAATLAALCITPATWAAVRSNSGADELMRQVCRDASTFAFNAAVLLFGGWAALAHFGLVPWLAPLALISGFAFIHLIAIFWISGKKGMLKPR